MYSNIKAPMHRRKALQGLASASLASITSITTLGCSTTADNPDVSVLLTLSEVLTGEHRIPFTLINKDGSRIHGATIKTSFYKLQDQHDEFMFSTTVAEHSIAISQNHIHKDGEVHEHLHNSDYYLAVGKAFEPGLWRANLEIQPTNGREYTKSTFFDVQDQSQTPMVGDPIPPSVNPVIVDPGDIGNISTADPPVAGMYRHTVAACLDRAEPMVIAFSTPAFCRSQMCGPVTAVAAELYNRWKDHVRFIHIEPFDIAAARTGGQLTFTPVAREWNLKTEPWIFVIDTGGHVTARFEGIVSPDELEPSIKAVATPARA